MAKQKKTAKGKRVNKERDEIPMVYPAKGSAVQGAKGQAKNSKKRSK